MSEKAYTHLVPIRSEVIARSLDIIPDLNIICPPNPSELDHSLSIQKALLVFISVPWRALSSAVGFYKREKENYQQVPQRYQ